MNSLRNFLKRLVFPSSLSMSLSERLEVQDIRAKFSRNEIKENLDQALGDLDEKIARLREAEFLLREAREIIEQWPVDELPLEEAGKVESILQTVNSIRLSRLAHTY